MTREAADRKLYENMKIAGAPEWVANSYYQILRKTGQSAWERAQKERNYSIPPDNPYQY